MKMITKNERAELRGFNQMPKRTCDLLNELDHKDEIIEALMGALLALEHMYGDSFLTDTKSRALFEVLRAEAEL